MTANKNSEVKEAPENTPPSRHTRPDTWSPIKYFRNSPRRLLTALLIVGLIFFAYNYWHTKQELDKLNNPSAASQADAQKLVDRISKFMVLPNEKPTLATVKDVSKLKGQEFFKNAQNGDKVLIFQQSGRALLYRPSTHKVIEYSKVGLNTSTQ